MPKSNINIEVELARLIGKANNTVRSNRESQQEKTKDTAKIKQIKTNLNAANPFFADFASRFRKPVLANRRPAAYVQPLGGIKVAVGFIALDPSSTSWTIWSGNGEVSIAIPEPGEAAGWMPNPVPPALQETSIGTPTPPIPNPFAFLTTGFDETYFDTVEGLDIIPASEWWRNGGVWVNEAIVYGSGSSGRGYPWGYVIPLGNRDMIFVYKVQAWGHNTWEQISATRSWSVTRSELINPDNSRVRYYVTPSGISSTQLGYYENLYRRDNLFACLVTYEGVREIPVPGIMQERMNRVQPDVTTFVQGSVTIDWPSFVGQSTWTVIGDGGAAVNFPFEENVLEQSLSGGFRGSRSGGYYGTQTAVDFLLDSRGAAEFPDTFPEVPYWPFEIGLENSVVDGRDVISLLRYNGDESTQVQGPATKWIRPQLPWSSGSADVLLGWDLGQPGVCRAKARSLGFTDADFVL
jgi:hypothetical protein